MRTHKTEEIYMLKYKSDHFELDEFKYPQFKLDYIDDVQFYPLDFELPAGGSIEDLTVAVVSVSTPTLRDKIHISVVDYLLIRTAYGINLNFMDAFAPQFKDLDKGVRDDLARSLIAAMEARELDYVFRGNALEEFFKLLGLSHSAFCQMTNISLNQILGALKSSGEITQYTYLNMLSMYRLLVTTLSLPSSAELLDKRTFSQWSSLANLFESEKLPQNIKDNGDTYEIAYSLDGKDYSYTVVRNHITTRDVNDILDIVKPAKKVKKYIRSAIVQLKRVNELSLPANCAEMKNGYVVNVDDQAYVFNDTELKYYRLGVVRRLLDNKKVKNEHKDEVKLALSQLVTFHFKKLFTSHKQPPALLVNSIQSDSPNLLAYDREVPTLCTGGVSVTFNGQDLFLTAADLFDIHAGLAIPMVVMAAGAQVCEELYTELDFIAHQYFVNEELYNSTWVDINKEFKITKADLVGYKIHDLVGRFSPERADRVAPSWQFLMLPIVANEVTGEA